MNFGSPAAVTGQVSWWCCVVAGGTGRAENTTWREVTYSAVWAAKTVYSVAKTIRLSIAARGWFVDFSDKATDESSTTELTGSQWDVAIRRGRQLETCSVLGVKAVLMTQWSIYWINLYPANKPALS